MATLLLFIPCSRHPQHILPHGGHVVVGLVPHGDAAAEEDPADGGVAGEDADAGGVAGVAVARQRDVLCRQYCSCVS